MDLFPTEPPIVGVTPDCSDVFFFSSKNASRIQWKLGQPYGAQAPVDPALLATLFCDGRTVAMVFLQPWSSCFLSALHAIV